MVGLDHCRWNPVPLESESQALGGRDKTRALNVWHTVSISTAVYIDPGCCGLAAYIFSFSRYGKWCLELELIHLFLVLFHSCPAENSQWEKQLCFAHWDAVTITGPPSLNSYAGNQCWESVKGMAQSSPCAQEDRRPPLPAVAAPPTSPVSTQRKWQEQ